MHFKITVVHVIKVKRHNWKAEELLHVQMKQ